MLVIASGASLLYEETEGLSGPGWGESVFSFYSLEDAVALREALRSFDRGRLVVNLIDMPIKCPVAPLEFCFLADWFLRERGVRDEVEITYATPLDAAFTKPVAAEHLGGMLEQKGHRAGDRVRDRAGRRRRRPADQLGRARDPLRPAGQRSRCTAAPPSSPAPRASATSSASSPVDIHTLQSKAAPNVFAIGDAASLPTSKAGSATHFEGETLVANIERFLAGEELEGSYDGHVNCFIESGFHKALLIDFNYEIEPLPGRYPEPHVGPLPLLRESRLNHLGKLAFQPLYWHMLLPGRDIPGIGAQMSMAGKQPVRKRTRRQPMSTAHLRRHRGRGRRRGLPAPSPSSGTSRSPQEIAAEAGIEQLTDRHWLVIDFMRDTYLESGSAPSIRTLGKASGVPIKELYQLFPKGPGEARGQDRRHPQAARLHLGREDPLTEQAREHGAKPEPIEKVSIIVSKGSLEGIYPGLIMANGARMEGIEANLFFTFFGLDAINKAKHEHVKVATVGNPGLHLATWAGGVPGVSALVTHKLAQEMEKLDIPPIPEFVEMIADSGGAPLRAARPRSTSSA